MADPFGSGVQNTPAQHLGRRHRVALDSTKLGSWGTFLPAGELNPPVNKDRRWIDYTRLKNPSRVPVLSMNQVTSGTRFVVNFIWTVKMLGYGALGAPQLSVATPKMLGYGALGAPQLSVATPKMLGYAVLYPVPWPRWPMWENPTVRRRTNVNRGYTWSAPLPLGIPNPPAVPFFTSSTDLPVTRRWRQTPVPQTLMPTALAAPFFGSAMDLPQRRRRSPLAGVFSLFPGGLAGGVRPVLFVVT